MKNEDKRFCIICGVEQEYPRQQFCVNLNCSGRVRKKLPATPSKNKQPNIIFGILDNGEIFVEVNGIQHTPTKSFYRSVSDHALKISGEHFDLKMKYSELLKRYSALEKSNKVTQDDAIKKHNELDDARCALLRISEAVERVGY